MLYSFETFFSTKSDNFSDTCVTSVSLDGLTSTDYVSDTLSRLPSLSPLKTKQKMHREHKYISILLTSGNVKTIFYVTKSRLIIEHVEETELHAGFPRHCKGK